MGGRRGGGQGGGETQEEGGDGCFKKKAEGELAGKQSRVWEPEM